MIFAGLCHTYQIDQAYNPFHLLSMHRSQKKNHRSGAAVFSRIINRVPGGHSLDQLHKALGLGIRPLRDGDALDVEITVRNKGAGHAVPTGMPGRRVILEVEIKAGTGASYSERRVYEKTFVDGTGRPVTRDRDYFTAGVEMRADTRIGPDEHRIESFRFPIPPDQTAYLTVRLHYEHSPMGNDVGRTWSTFFSEKRTIAAAPGAPPGS